MAQRKYDFIFSFLYENCADYNSLLNSFVFGLIHENHGNVDYFNNHSKLIVQYNEGLILFFSSLIVYVLNVAFD